MSHRKTAVAVGFLFFFQMLTFLIGSAMIKRYLDGDAEKSSLVIGVLFEMVAGVAIVAIGVLMYRVLKTVNSRLAIGYPLMRSAEFAVSAVLSVYLLVQLQEFANQLLWVYIPTGIGGLILTYLLYTSRLVPRFIAGLGLVGYALLLVGVVLGFAGTVDPNSGSGLALLAPGGVFEFIVLPIWLIAKGFRTPVAPIS